MNRLYADGTLCRFSGAAFPQTNKQNIFNFNSKSNPFVKKNIIGFYCASPKNLKIHQKKTIKKKKNNHSSTLPPFSLSLSLSLCSLSSSLHHYLSYDLPPKLYQLASIGLARFPGDKHITY
jgi:hypothetical protein